MERDEEGTMRSENPGAVVTRALPRLEPLRSVRTATLEVAYFEAGLGDGEVVLLLHGFPYDIHSYIDVIPRLVVAGHRVIAPYLRGHGPTRFLDSATPRSGQQAAIGSDVIALLDALGIPRAIFAGYDWGHNAVPASSPSTATSFRT
jgi:pimeloyl-ACP methyl ester carboxylesterase